MVGKVSLYDKIDTLDKLIAYINSVHPAGWEGPAMNDRAVQRVLEYLGHGMDDENFWMWREFMRAEVSYNKMHEARNIAVELPGYTFDKYHFLHVAHADVTKVAYTENANKGRHDIQLRTTIGRYIKKFYPDKNDDEIRLVSAAYTLKYVPPTIMFAMTEDEIEDVYEKSPFGSCMKRSHDSIRTETHPVRCYASGDFAVAYYLNSEDKVAARAVCALNEEGNPLAGGKYTRVYGDSDRMTEILTKAGFVKDTNAYEGKRLLDLSDDGGTVMPYIDGSVIRVSKDGAYWVLSKNSRLDAQQSSGYLGGYIEDEDGGVDTRECDNCSNVLYIEDMRYSEYHEEMLCDDCVERHYEYALVGRGGVRDYIHDDLVEYCKSSGEYYMFNDRFQPDDVGLVYDINNELQELDNCVLTMDECFQLSSDCTNVGENYNGPLYVDTSDIATSPENFWKNVETGYILHEEDENVAEWLGNAGEEDHYPLFYKSMVDVLAKERAHNEAMAVLAAKDAAERAADMAAGKFVSPIPISLMPRPVPVGTVIKWMSYETELAVEYNGGTMFSKRYGHWSPIQNGIEVMVISMPVKTEETV